MPRTPSALLLLALAPLGVAADLYVESSGDDATNDCTASASPCATVAHALTVSADGDAVNIGAGDFATSSATYPLMIPPGVGLVGQGPDLTHVDLSPTQVAADAANDARTPLFEATDRASLADLHLGPAAKQQLNAALTGPVELSVDNVHFEGTESARGIFGYGIWDPNGGPVNGTISVTNSTFDGAQFVAYPPGVGPWALSLTGNTFGASGQDAIGMRFTDGSSASTVGDVTVQIIDNVFDAPDPAFGYYNAAVGLGFDGDLIADALVQGNVFNDQPSRGVDFEVDADAIVTADIVGNTSTNGNHPIYLTMSSTGTLLGSIRGNTLTNPSGDAITLLATDEAAAIDMDIVGNTITGAGGYGMLIGNTDSSGNIVHASIRGNTVTGGQDSGLRLVASYETSNALVVDLRNNTIADNAGDGVKIDDYSGGFAGTFVGNVITGNGRNGIWATSDSPGFFLEMHHNTIADNAAGYTNDSAYDVHAGAVYDHAVLAMDNWWGTTDRAIIDAHILDGLDNSGRSGQVLYTALDDTLAFHPATAQGPSSGGQLLALLTDDGAPPFVWTAGVNPLVVTVDGADVTPRQVTNDGHVMYLIMPPHAAGLVDITVTNPGGQSGVATGAYAYVDPVTFADEDADSVHDSVDNCLGVANTSQIDTDRDGVGDLCDNDDDGDGVNDATDLCPLVSDDQTDTDADGIGDACDDDRDDDGVLDLIDNCTVANADQLDTDNDGIGDACDLDLDGDGVVDSQQGGCACTTGSPTPAAPLGLGLLALVALRRRRR